MFSLFKSAADSLGKRLRLKAFAALVIAAWTSFACLNTFATADIFEEYAVKAALTLNFARFTEWPPNNNNRIKLCTLGNNIVQSAFAEVENKLAGNKPLTVINLIKIRETSQCQLLFVSGMEKNQVIQLLAEIANLPILTIGEEPDFLQNGGMVLLTVDNGKVSLEINLGAVKKAGMQISSRVLKLAKIFNS